MALQDDNRVPLLSDDEMDPSILKILDQYPRINIYTLLAHSPSVCKPWIELINGIYSSGFSSRLREIALVRIGAVMPSVYELHQHQMIALKNGVTEEEIQTIIHDKKVKTLDEDANLICQTVDEIKQTGTISEHTFHELSGKFSTKDMVSLGVLIAMYFAVSIFVNFTRAEIEKNNPLNNFKGFK